MFCIVPFSCETVAWGRAVPVYRIPVTHLHDCRERDCVVEPPPFTLDTHTETV